LNPTLWRADLENTNRSSSIVRPFDQSACGRRNQKAAIGAERYRRQRTHKPEQVKQIAASIREFGFTKRSGPVSLLGLVGAGIVRVRHKIGRAAQHDPVGICISGSSFFMGRKNYRREIRRAAETLRFQSDGREFFLKPGAVWAVFCPDVP